MTAKSIDVKFPKPRILLIDVGNESQIELENRGFNVTAGSFGIPYRVERNDDILPVIPNWKLEQVEEQEIVVVDLASRATLDGPQGHKATSDGETDWWAKCSRGIIDPRPRAMAAHTKMFDRILEHGGVIVVFAEPRIQQQLFLARKDRYGNVTIDEKIDRDNWGFLSLLHKDILEVVEDHGSEVLIPDDSKVENPWIAFAKEAEFTCTVDIRNWFVKQTWAPIVTNKYGSPVGGVLAPIKNRNGFVIILPQVRDKRGILLELITGELPGTLPALFPHIEGAKWTQRTEYELPQVSELKRQILEVETHAREKASMLREQVETVRQEMGFLHQLLTAQDRELVEAVQKTFHALGFVNVIDVDAEREAEGVVERDEDLRITDKSPLLLVEVKGVSGVPSDADSLQVSKHLAPRMKQLDRRDIQGLTIMNHQRHLPSLDRENRTPFRDVILQASKKQEVGLMTTWDLHRLARSFVRNRWTHGEIEDLFYQTGRIEPIPKSYRLVGVIDEYWEKVSAISLKAIAEPLSKGDSLAFELPVEFVEHPIDTMHQDKSNIARAEVGQTVAIGTILTKTEAKAGTRVFKVMRAKPVENARH